VKYPLAAVTLILIAGVFSILASISTWSLSGTISEVAALEHLSQLAGLVMVKGLWLLADGIILILLALMIKEERVKNAHQAGVVAIILSLLSFNFLVMVFGIVGGILALIWVPETSETYP